MSTVIKHTKYRVYILSNDHGRPHVHVYAPRKKNWEAHAKIEIQSRAVIVNKGFKNKEIILLQSLIKDNEEFLVGKWNEVQNEQE